MIESRKYIHTSANNNKKKKNTNTIFLVFCAMLAFSVKAFTTTTRTTTIVKRAFTTSLAFSQSSRSILVTNKLSLPSISSSLSIVNDNHHHHHHKHYFNHVFKRFHWSEYYKKSSKSSTGIFMYAEDDNENDDRKDGSTTTTATEDETTSNGDLDRTWDIGGLKKEVIRLTVRCHKKIGKASQRLQKANDEVERLTSDPNVSLEELEQCPNIEGLENDLQELRTRLTQLNKLEVLLQDVKGKNVVLPEHIAKLALELEVDDEPPNQQQQQPRKKKEKGPKNMTSFRLPYRRYYTANKTEIRVGKQAEDNDELTLNPKYRDSLDWWMHASGCAGSHVVIRCHDQTLDEEVVQDAAALAARQSKCTGANIKVSLTRARDIKKPPGAKAGLVQLTGQVRTVVVNMKKAEERLNRLDKTVLIN